MFLLLIKNLFWPIMEDVDHKVSLIPDFISSGMARVFAYFMEKKVQMTDEPFSRYLRNYKKAILKAYALNNSKN
jgi:hypothetical protein